MYRISKKERQYSPTPIVKVTVDESGKEIETIICICTGKKKEGDERSKLIVEYLNYKERDEIYIKTPKE